ncbi:DNA replication protein DnaD [[Bacillus] enclensis]|jgi:DNA replication protein|uniref:DNA replication protein n=2 Tax=Rossellomorea TaxID=2837508 RepID=A0A0V8HLK8_9BACI|nr:DnaD domain-containing protein [[Bacillus] enclensis]KSU63438.1 DNA replication protein DnaD [[Bacillus] enclensis]MBH9967727.1 DnaD domain-containing protein [[Bacillus] enclensis]QWC21458.1 DnaD domain-containing protein [Bacillus haikouensis]SCB83956.1 DNA replication protein [[Bacillus] enclensis]
MDYKQLMVSWIEEGTLNIPQLLLTNYHTLGLNESEFVLLLHIYGQIEKGNSFPTPEDLSEHMSISAEYCSSILRKLIQQQFLTIDEGSSPDGILFEKYSLAPLWEKLADFVIQTSKMKQMQKSMEEEADIYSIFEQEFGRPLSPLECETLSMWLDQDEHNSTIIKAALREAVISGKLNFRYIDRILFEWKKNGVKTIEDARSQSQKFRPHQKPQTQNDAAAPKRKSVPFYNWLEQ